MRCIGYQLGYEASADGAAASDDDGVLICAVLMLREGARLSAAIHRVIDSIMSIIIFAFA
jgi:hypothetical protein